MKTLTYNTSEIRFGDLSEVGFNAILHSERFASAKKVVIIDENVSDLWLEFLITSFSGLEKAEIIVLPAGEENKVLEICNQVWTALSEYEIGRNDLIINVGGGVITDLGGFIAATFKRGMAFINVPTTLLSQVDASVGGKTGIDLGPYKNQIGVFADADYVFIDPRFLTTLPAIEIESGFAEMLKHGLIAFKTYWEELKKINPVENPQGLLAKIRASVSIKRDIVAKDHKEGGIRKTLNFGHTIGHALEGYCLSQNNAIPHGYGVAWGMVAESYISLEMKLISKTEFNEIDTFIRSIYPPLALNQDAIPALESIMRNDKKNKSGIMQFTLLKGIGATVYDQKVSSETIQKALQFILSPSE